MVKLVDQVVVEPKTDGIALKAKMVGSFEQIKSRLGSMQNFEIKIYDEKLVAVRIESRDIQKRPFLFVINEFFPESLNIEYTIANDASPKMRKLSVLKDTLGMLSIISDIYNVDISEIFQYIDSAVSDVMGSISQNYSTLFNSYDAIFNDYKELKKANFELSASNKTLAVRAVQLTDENQRLNERIKILESYSDQSLMSMVEEWLTAHDGEIDIVEFSDTYKMSPTRVEEILNKMVAMGYISLKG